MNTRGVKLNFDEKSHRFGQNNGPALILAPPPEAKQDEDGKYPTKIDWPYKTKHGYWVFDVTYGNNEKIQKSMASILCIQSYFHEPIITHIQNNTNACDKQDKELIAAIKDLQEYTTHDIMVGDVVSAPSNESKHYYFVVDVKHIDNEMDFDFIIDNTRDIGIYSIDLSINDITNEHEIVADINTIYISHNKLDKIELNLNLDASLRVKFGHLKYYDTSLKLIQIETENNILAGRLTSIRNQTLQTLGKGFSKKLNDKSKRTTRYTVSRFCGATAWVRVLVPYLESLELNKNWRGNGRLVSITLTKLQMKKIFGNWAEKTNMGDPNKGEKSVCFWGRNVTFKYSFATNMITLRFSVARRSI